MYSVYRHWTPWLDNNGYVGRSSDVKRRWKY